MTEPTLAYIQRVSEDLNRWYREWDDMHKQSMGSEVMRNMRMSFLIFGRETPDFELILLLSSIG